MTQTSGQGAAPQMTFTVPPLPYLSTHSNLTSTRKRWRSITTNIMALTLQT